jgi:hypothetical protein
VLGIVKLKNGYGAVVEEKRATEYITVPNEGDIEMIKLTI